MKKYLYLLLGLSLIGATLSFLLLYQHYYPDASLSQASCLGTDNSCMQLATSKYSSVLGIPVAAFGLFFYLFIIFTILLADYAEGIYQQAIIVLIFPLLVFSVIIDFGLAATLIRIKLTCLLCIMTYIVNIALLVIMIFWLKSEKKNNQLSLKSIYRNVIGSVAKTSESRAALASFTMFSFLLVFSIITTTQFLNSKTGAARSDLIKNLSRYKKEVKKFASAPLVQPVPVDTAFQVGTKDAKNRFVIFNDFLCSFCYKLYKVEKKLLENADGDIEFFYISYPLDKECNTNVTSTVYENSCIASKAMIAANKMGIFEQYLDEHFYNYADLHNEYTMEKAVEIFNTVVKKNNLSIKAEDFAKIMKSEETKQILQQHIALAKKYKIKGTPHIILNQKRIKGYRPVEFFNLLFRKQK